MNEQNEMGDEIIRFGNWVVTEEGIFWDGDVPRSYFIAKERLWEVRPDEEKNKWDWLVHLTEKTWIKEKENIGVKPTLLTNSFKTLGTLLNKLNNFDARSSSKNRGRWCRKCVERRKGSNLHI